MRAILWFLALFALAVGVALFAGNNTSTVTFFWSPWRVDLSMNLFVVLLLGSFGLMYLWVRALSILFGLPQRARRWRLEQKERAMHARLLETIAHLWAGRYVRAIRSAQTTLAQAALKPAHDDARLHITQLRTIAHLLAAQSAHLLRDTKTRDTYIEQALQESEYPDAQGMREAALLRAAQWSIDDEAPAKAMESLKALPQGATRRTLAMHLRLKASHLLGENLQALEITRLLIKHGVLSPSAGSSMLRRIGKEALDDAHDVSQLERTWKSFASHEQQIPELAVHAAQRVMKITAEEDEQQGAAQAREWLIPIWNQYESLDENLRRKFVCALQTCLSGIEPQWLAQIEAAQQANPRDPYLQYLAGMACLRSELWGKAQQLLSVASTRLTETELLRQTWRALAQLAQQRGDHAAAHAALEKAAAL